MADQPLHFRINLAPQQPLFIVVSIGFENPAFHVAHEFAHCSANAHHPQAREL